MAYESVVFIDLDATLINGPFERAVWPEVLGELARKSGYSEDKLREYIEIENEERQHNPTVAPTAAMDWDDIVETVAKRLGVKLEASVVALANAHASNSFVLDEGKSVLRELAQPHRALVVATKGLAKYQRPILDALGLTSLFSDILTPDTHNTLKKDKAFFGDWPRQTRLQIMVGDRYDDDVAGPAAHGFKTIWKVADLNPKLKSDDSFERARLFEYAPNQPTPADAIICSLQELPNVVKHLEKAVLGISD
jgi:FMN phosphatase YigB (HAD superfamily)